jgi:hypothetical protein
MTLHQAESAKIPSAAGHYQELEGPLAKKCKKGWAMTMRLSAAFVIWFRATTLHGCKRVGFHICGSGFFGQTHSDKMAAKRSQPFRKRFSGQKQALRS